MRIKRFFDFILSFSALLILAPLLIFLIIIASFNTQSFGLFSQKRVGQFGKLFTILKIKTVHPKSGFISSYSFFLRRSKLDELPQLFNILKGEMSFVGPRPDISGYYDRLTGENRLILNLKPGLTSEASLKYADEDQILSKKDNPLQYNDEVLFPDKVKINLNYYCKRTFYLDLKIIWNTIFL
jgi:lipopolysaccharide/colanic/teichoic acid biosynthesis glycosyltransferase